MIMRGHVVTKWLKSEETSESHLVQVPCSSRTTYRWLPRAMSRMLLNIFRGIRTHTARYMEIQGNTALLNREMRRSASILAITHSILWAVIETLILIKTRVKLMTMAASHTELVTQSSLQKLNHRKKRKKIG